MLIFFSVNLFRLEKGSWLKNIQGNKEKVYFLVTAKPWGNPGIVDRPGHASEIQNCSTVIPLTN